MKGSITQAFLLTQKKQTNFQPKLNRRKRLHKNT